jgi:hypothetical protein
MSINIDITSNVFEVMASLPELNQQVFYQATRTSIGKALVAGRAQAAKGLRERLNIKSADVKRKIGMTKPKGSSLFSLEGILSFDDTPQPLIDFVRGNKEVIKQAGVKVKRRRVLKVEITKGKTFKMKGGFIQKVRTKQVFRRGKSGRFYKQSAPSIAKFIQEHGLKDPVIKRMKEVFLTNIKNQYEFRLERYMAKKGRNWNDFKKV